MERLQEGSILDSRYRVHHRLGSGGMADVFCAEDLQLGRKVALKLLYRRFAEDEEFVERVQGGQGGTVAAPIAKRVLEALGD